MSGNTNWDTPPNYGPSGPPAYPISHDDEDTSSDINDDSTIITIYPMVMDEKPDDLDLASSGWTDFAKQLDKTKQELHANYNPVGAEWDSDAGVAFSAYVAKSTYSLENWYDAANNNAKALSTLSGKIRGLQDKMQKMWDDGNGNGFAPEIKAAEDKQKNGHALWDGLGAWTDGWSLGWNGYDTDLDPVMENYTKRVKSEIVEPMNGAFRDAYGWLSGGMKFDGPTNGPSLQDIQGAIKKLNAPSVGPVGMPSAPGASKPPMPATPPMPADPPPMPTAVTPPNPPTAPTTPNAPTAPTAPVAPNAPKAPQAMTKPDAPTGPTAPNAPSAPNAPTAPQGLGAVPPLPSPVRSPGGIPSAPSVPEGPSTSGLGDGAPPSGFGEPESMGGPGRPIAAGMPKSLQGRGGGMPGEPEMPPGMRSGMRTPPPTLRGRRNGKPDKRAARPGGPNNDEPEMPPGRGTSALSGRNGRQNERTRPDGRPGGPGPGGDDVPPNRLGSPRNLQGIRDRRPRWRPGSLEAEELPLRRLPTLTGRLSPELAAEESLETAQQALRPGLGGRGLCRPAERRRSEEREATRPTAPTVDFVGDSELFAAAKAAPSVIDRPKETTPVAPQNPALRPKAPAGA